jgi:hypothetical protein
MVRPAPDRVAEFHSDFLERGGVEDRHRLGKGASDIRISAQY